MAAWTFPRRLPTMRIHAIDDASLWQAAEPRLGTIQAMEDLSDEELVRLHRRNADSRAAERYINELFRRYHKRVAMWCYRLAGDRNSAADQAQEIFLKAYTHLDSFRGDAKFSTWMYMIARNHCYNEFRSRAARPEHTSDAVLAELADDQAENVEESLERMESAESVRALLAQTLDETERKVMTLHYGEELTLNAVTRLLGLNNASGAKAHIVSARRKLKVALRRLNPRQRESR
jgi:RNA polymerase sigma-70 factor (ECF subfamily)